MAIIRLQLYVVCRFHHLFTAMFRYFLKKGDGMSLLATEQPVFAGTIVGSALTQSQGPASATTASAIEHTNSGLNGKFSIWIRHKMT